MEFVLDDEYARRFDTILHTNRTTNRARTSRGYRIVNPYHQKSEDIYATRMRIRNDAWSWFRDHFPGAFSFGLLDATLPTCEFVSTRQAEPFPTGGGTDDRPPLYMKCLDLGHAFDAWYCQDHPDLKLSWWTPFGEENPYHMLLAMREGALDNDDAHSPARQGRSGEIYYVDQRVQRLLCGWSLLPLLEGYGRALGSTRDAAARRPRIWRVVQRRLQEFRDHVSYSVDVAAVTNELAWLGQGSGRFMRYIDTFKPCRPDLYGEPPSSLAELLRTAVRERADWLSANDAALRDHLTQYGALLAAHENVRLQRALRTLTLVIALLTCMALIPVSKDFEFAVWVARFLEFLGLGL